MNTIFKGFWKDNSIFFQINSQNQKIYNEKINFFGRYVYKNAINYSQSWRNLGEEISRFVSAMVRTLYVATFRAWKMLDALRPGAESETWLRIAPLWPYFVMARLLSSPRFSVLFGSDPGSVCCASIFVCIVVILPLYWDTSPHLQSSRDLA